MTSAATVVRLYHVTDWKVGDARGKGGGFGFATADRARVFVHASTLCEHLRPAHGAGVQLGTVVHVEVAPEREGDRGPRAATAVCPACATPPRWEWRLTGRSEVDLTTGDRAVEVEAVQVAGKKVYTVPDGSGFSFHDGWERNAPYRHAVEVQAAWARGDVEGLIAAFGEPAAHADGDHVRLAWSHGEKRVPAEAVLPLWGVEPWTSGDPRVGGGIRVVGPAGPDRYGSVEVLAHVRSVDGPLWLRVADVAASAAAYSPVAARNVDVLDDATRADVSAVVASLVPSPESFAEADLARDGATARLRRGWLEYERLRAALHCGPVTAKERSWSGRRTVSYPESDDGYRAAGSYDVFGSYAWLEVSATPRDAARTAAVLGDRWHSLASFDAGRTADSLYPIPTDVRDRLLGATPEGLRDAHLRERWGSFLREVPRRGVVEAASAALYPAGWLARYEARWRGVFAETFDPAEWDRTIAWLDFHQEVTADPKDPTWEPTVVEVEYATGSPCYGVAVLNCQRETVADPLLVSRWTRDRAEADLWSAIMLAGLPALRGAAAVEARVRSMLEEAAAGDTYDLRTAVYDAGAGGSRLTPAIGSQLDRSDDVGVRAWVRRVGALLAGHRADVARRGAEREAEVHRKLGASAAIRASVPEDAVEVECSFGSPTNRMVRDGFWDWPVVVYDEQGREVGRAVVVDGTWTASSGVAVVATDRRGGHHGGHVTLKLLVPPGARASHEQPCREQPDQQESSTAPKLGTLADVWRRRS